MPAIDFGHDLSEEQQEEGQDDRDTDESQPRRVSEVYDTVEDIIAQHDDGDVDQVVGDENGRQRTFAVLPQCLYLLSVFRCSGSSALRSDGERLKNAISDALAYPENNKSATANSAAMHTASVGGMKLTPPNV